MRWSKRVCEEEGVGEARPSERPECLGICLLCVLCGGCGGCGGGGLNSITTPLHIAAARSSSSSVSIHPCSYRGLFPVMTSSNECRLTPCATLLTPHSPNPPQIRSSKLNRTTNLPPSPIYISGDLALSGPTCSPLRKVCKRRMLCAPLC